MTWLADAPVQHAPSRRRRSGIDGHLLQAGFVRGQAPQGARKLILARYGQYRRLGDKITILISIHIVIQNWLAAGKRPTDCR